MKNTTINKLISLALCLAMVVSWLPQGVIRTAAAATNPAISTVADPETLTRPGTIYGDSTVNAGKITVGKSVSTESVTVNGQTVALNDANNFLVTISQSAQVMGLASESSVPVDVVLVLDTSGSMEDNNRAKTMVTAANAAIATLMDANAQNRVGVVAFSSEGYGGGTSGDNAASVLSSLAHYTGTAATAHLRWVDEDGDVSNNGSYIAGRDTVTITTGNGWNQQTTTVNAYRHGLDGGTNIQAGIIAGAEMLTDVTSTTYTDPTTGETVNRIPFLIILSDGQPTFTYSDETWYSPAGSDQQGPGDSAYEGNGFIAAVTAAYYKSKITQHYYGTDAGGNQCYIYTMGIELESLEDDEQRLAYITLDPKEYTSGTYAEDNADSYWNYGNTADNNNPNSVYGWKDYWARFQAGKDFGVRVNSGDNYYIWSGTGEPQAYYELSRPRRPGWNASQTTWDKYYADLEAYEAWEKWVADNFTEVSGEHYIFTADTIAAAKPYVTSIAYNDAYYGADKVSDLQTAFQDMVTTIQQKAMSVPTKVTTGDHDFDGYVTFTDPLGEYMEVKDMKGVVAGGYFYQGVSFAQKLAAYGTGAADAEFDALLVKVLQTRTNMTASNVNVADLLAKAKGSSNQAYYNSPNDYDNSIVWWGNAYNSGEEDEQVQMMGFADNDTIDYITDANTVIPTGADYVCRSYFFYGEAGGANPNPDHEYLYFMVRIQRELVAPYRETVVISAPASLLSMEKVLITEATDDNGNLTYTAAVEHKEPARMVYEVGLWDSITSENVSSVVSAEYANETVNGGGSVNYDAATGTYNFFTNDWDRSETLGSHHRAMAKATFDAAADNEFYTYQVDTLLVDENGNPVTSNPAGKTAYYAHEYYEWSDNGVNGTYTATKKSSLIKVDVPANAVLTEKDGKWYVPKGTYTAATLVVNGDDTNKGENKTGTSSVVAHPHRTGEADNSHYTVLLGNNGMLTLKSDPYEPKKTVSIDLDANATQITDDQGNPVQVNDVLTYTVEVKNILAEPATLTVTDYVPLGTKFIAGSAGSGETLTGHTKDASIKPDSNNVLTWVLEDVPAGATRYISFQAVVTEAALSMATVAGNITNTASFRINNGVNVSSNTTTNPVFGKTVTDVNNQGLGGQGGLKVGDVLVYHVRFHNHATDANGNYVTADVTVTDKLDAGLTFLSADNGGSYDAATHTVTWTVDDMAADTSMVVTLQAQVNAAAEVVNGAIGLSNSATVVVNNEVVQTNKTENWVEVGDLSISKTVAQGGDTSKTFTIHLTESTGLLSGTFAMLRGTAQETVQFTGGKATVSIRHGDVLTIQDLPAGAIISVAEDTANLPGWTASYDTQSVTIREGAATAVASVSVTNTYALKPLTVTLKGEKVMEGVAMDQEATFGFVAMPDGGDPLTGEVTVQATGKYSFTFSPKTFIQTGTYKYTISEIDGGLKGITYDTTKYVLVITVADNRDGTMRATATLDGAAFDLTTDTVGFTNRYTPEDVQLELTADKAMTGRQLTAGEFNFLLTDGTNSYKGINDANGNIIFETITYTAAGTYTYTMSEVVPANKAQGVSYDSKTYTVQVEVTDNNGQLTTAVTVGGKGVTVTDGVADTGVVFANSFTPDDVPLNLVAKKALRVYDAASGEYILGTAAAGAYRFNVVSKADGNLVSTGVNDGNGNIQFNTIYFSDAMLEGAASKTFTFVISEIVPTVGVDPNMLYDSTKHEITATLTKNADGTLTVSVGSDSDGNVDTGITFTNYQNPTSVEVRPVGSKTTSDAPADVSFSFTVVNTATGNEAAAGVGAANGSITFSKLSFEVPGTYTYWIYESNAGNTTNGITYDASRYLMKVVVSRNSFNRLVPEVTYWASNTKGSQDVADYTVPATAPSFHNEYHAGGFINVTATKQLNGRSLKDNEFAFKLVRQDNGGEIDGLAASDGSITFSTMYYSGADIPAGQTSAVIHYVMSEVVPTTAALPGVTYDKSTHDVYVRITDQGNGQIKAELVKPEGDGYTVIQGDDTGVVFTNTYAATQGDTVSYRIRKNLVGRDVRAGEFEFGLYLNGKLEDVATNDENGIVTFTRTIPASAAQYSGMYEMVIKEEKGSSAGITYSTQEYKIYVKVADNGQGKIEATVHLSENGPALAEDANGVVDLTNEIVFNNTYEPHDASYAPVATKTLTGRTMVAGEFTFRAQLISQNGSAVTDGVAFSGINAADGTVVFQSIPYTDEGTFVYRLSEVAGTHSGVKYDSAVYYLQVVVTDDGNGHLKATPGYYSNEACTAAINAVEFKNSYTPADATVQLEGTKQLTGRRLQDKEFSFVVRENDVNGEVVATGSNDASGKIHFSSFDITADDMGTATTKEFKYVVVESDNNKPGITTDKTVIAVTVTVTDDGNGHLSADVRYDAPILFKNIYTPAAAELSLVAFKSLTGKNLSAGEYTFELKEGSTVKQSVSNDARGVVRFENLKFTAAGTYTYTLSEKSGNDTRVDYDKTVYTITVQVTDDLNGNLVATATYKKGSETVELLSFANIFTPAALELELEGTKVITDVSGTVLDMDKAGFEFEVRDAEGNLLTTATSNSQGQIKITGLSFTAAGEYRLLITEKDTGKGGFTVDPTVWCAHIAVAYNANEGVLSKTGEFVHVAPESHDGVMVAASQDITFTNVYAPEPVDLILKVGKALTGRELKDHDFTFQMVDKATGLIAAESRNHANGEIPFHLTLTEAKTYNFRITELDEGKAGVTYSKETYHVSVEVIDDGTGALKAKVGNVVAQDGQSVDISGTVVFHNTYKAKPVDVTIEAHKRLEGKGLTAGIFQFQLVNSADEEDVRTATNAVDGKIAFEPITFTEPGTYSYVMSEVVGNAGGVTYDTASYNVTIDVVDLGTGELLADVRYFRGEQETDADPVFLNTYKAEKVGVQIQADKELEGKDLKGEDFTFVLMDSQGNAVQATNDANGKVIFDTIEYVVTGTHTYTMYEMAGNDRDITYDQTSYQITVTVTDDGEGSLVADVVYNNGTKNVDKAVFSNVYTDPAAIISVEAKKVLTGKTLTDGMFTFQLVNKADTAQKYTATNAADGKIVFKDLRFEKAGVYTYTLTEVKGSEKGMAYDTTAYTVTVTVTEGADGKLTAAVDYHSKTVQFNNTFTPAANPNTGDETPVVMYAGLMTLSILAMAALFLLRRKEQEN